MNWNADAGAEASGEPAVFSAEHGLQGRDGRAGGTALCGSGVIRMFSAEHLGGLGGATARRRIEDGAPVGLTCCSMGPELAGPFLGRGPTGYGAGPAARAPSRVGRAPRNVGL